MSRIGTVLKVLAVCLGASLWASAPGTAAQSLKVTVIGGNGMIGQRVVREALARGHQVTMLVRDLTGVREKHERLRVAKGDVLDTNGLADAVRGQDVVISAVGAARAENPDYTLDLQAADSFIEALRGLGESAPRLIVVGGVGTLKDATGAPVLDRVPEERLPEHQGQKAALDFYRTVSDVQWTYVSPPGRIAPGERKGVYRVGDDELIVDDKGESAISMEDYAVALLDEAQQPRHLGRRFTVGY